MKKALLMSLVLFIPLVTVCGKDKEKVDQNIMVWGVVEMAEDSLNYLTMYKNCPAEVTAQFHFDYMDNTCSEMYDLIMPDSVAEVFDPTPVSKPVKEVVIDKVVYAAVQENGDVYRTEDPNDPVLAMLLVDLFDSYHDLFWFDVFHRATYYHDRDYVRGARSGGHSASRVTRNSSSADDLNLDKVDDTALLIGVTAVALASAGMAMAVIRNWDRVDDRFPYFSLSPQIQFMPKYGIVRDVVQLKARIGNYGGFSFIGDLGYTTGTLGRKDMYDPGLTWSVGLGFDLGAFSLSLRGEPAFFSHAENFLSCNAVYDIFLTENLALDLSAGVGLLEHEGDYYADIPLSLGVLWRF